MRGVRRTHLAIQPRCRAGRRLLQFAAAAAPLLLSQRALCTVYSWDGGATGAGSLNWSNAVNWTLNTAPVSATTTDLFFAGTTNVGTSGNPLNQNIASPIVINSLTFNSGAGAFFFSGSQIQFNGTSSALTQNASNTMTIGNPISVSAATAFGGTGSGPVVFSGVFTGSGALTIGSGTFQLNGDSPSYTGTVRVDFGATLQTTRGANATYTPFGATGLTLNGGTVTVTETGNSNDVTAQLPATTFAGGNILRINNSGGGSSHTVVTTASLARASGSKGTLIINDVKGSPGLGSTANQGERLTVTSGAPSPTNGMVDPYYVRISAANTAADFVTYSSPDGFASAAASYTSGLAGTGGTQIANVTTDPVVNSDRDVYALRTSVNITQSGTRTVTIRSGGLLINGNSTISPNLIFGTSGTPAEGIAFVASGSAGTFSGNVTASDLTKFGAGQLRLNGTANSITGSATINTGTLSLGSTANLPSSSVAIHTGAHFDVSAFASGFNVPATQTIKGTGTVDGRLNLGGGAKIAPGFSTGIITTGNEEWQSGGVYEWELTNATAAAGVGFDQIQMQSLTISATSGSKFTIKLIGSNPANFSANPPAPGFYSWTIATTTGVTGFNASKFNIDTSNFTPIASGGHFNVRLSGNDVQITYVPEPASSFVVMGALAALTRRRRRALR